MVSGNVVKLLPAFAKPLLGYQALPKRAIPRKFDLWKPDRMPIFIPIFLCAIGVLILSIIMHNKFKDHENQIKNGGICKRTTNTLLKKSNILFVFAHPDDEVMFFSPTILTFLSSPKYTVSFLCFSNGNSAGLGKIRSQELIRSGIKLGVEKDKIHIIDHVDLADGMSSNWDSVLISDILLDFLKKNDIEAIITFDEGGVSGHVNHIAVYQGVWRVIYKKDLPSGVVAYKLITTGRIRKFASVLDVPYSYWGGEAMFVSSWTNRTKALEAMAEHQSQWVWFRKLYMLVSRYMLVNTLERMQGRHNHSTDRQDRKTT